MSTRTFRFKANVPLVVNSGDQKVDVPAGATFTIPFDDAGIVNFIGNLAAVTAAIVAIDDKPATQADVTCQAPSAAEPRRRAGFYE